MRQVKIVAVLPVSLYAAVYMLVNGVKPQVGIIIPLLYWFSIGFKYIELTGQQGSLLKQLATTWFWPLVYFLRKEKTKTMPLYFSINGVQVFELNFSEYAKELTSACKNYWVYWLQAINVLRSAILASIITVTFVPVLIFSLCLLHAYLNKVYLWDLMERWQDAVEPMKEAKAALLAIKLLTITLFFRFLRNEFTATAKERLRIKNNVVTVGKYQVSPSINK